MVLSSMVAAALAPAAPNALLTGSDWDVLGAILAAGPVVKAVMLLLLAFSVLSWTIIFSKFRQLGRARREDAEFYRIFWAAPDPTAARRETEHLRHSPAAGLLRQTLKAGISPGANPADPAAAPDLVSRPGDDPLRRAVRRALTGEGEGLSRNLSFLATCGNTAPFIGLFGTVWGIMTSFHAIGVKGSASLATVAPGIAEALIATAAGLAAAIPAVMAYNYFLGQVRRRQSELGDFAADLAALLENLKISTPSP
jgi:biopolymer transport protein TolQ